MWFKLHETLFIKLDEFVNLISKKGIIKQIFCVSHSRSAEDTVWMKSETHYRIMKKKDPVPFTRTLAHQPFRSKHRRILPKCTNYGV